MVTLSQRITELREEQNLSRPALAAALGLPKLSIEKFETGRQTPTQEQQEKMAAFFGVSVFYLQGKSRDRTRMDDWMAGMEPAEELDGPGYVPTPVKRPVPAQKVTAAPPAEGGLFDVLLTSKKFRQSLSDAVLETLRSPEGQEILAQLIRKELDRQR